MNEPPPHDRALADRVAEHLPALQGYVRRRLGERLAARESVGDLVQSTCRELLAQSAPFEDRGEASFRRWILAAAEHKIRNRARHWRAACRDGVTESIEPGTESHAGNEPADPHAEGPSRDAMLAEESASLARALSQLSEEYQLVIYRLQYEGASYEEVARELGRSPEAIRKLQARALARLSGLLV